MDGIATFLLGGAVGLALGYLASRKRSHKPVTTMPDRSTGTPPAAPPPVGAEEPVLSRETTLETTGTAATAVLEASPAEEAVVEEEVAEGPITEAVLAEELLAKELLVEGIVVEEAAVEEAVVEEAALEEAALEEAAVEEAAVEEAAEIRVVAEPEELVTEEAAVEETVVETPAVQAGEMLDETAGVPTAVVAEEPEYLPPLAEGPLEEAVETAPPSAWEGYAPLPSEEAVADVPALAEADLAEIEFVDLTDLETPVVDVSAEAEVGVEGEAGPESAVQAGPETPPVISPVDDLKARIEETRRRIRRELEQPFVSVDELERTQDWTVSPVIRATEEVVESAPAEAGPAEARRVDVATAQTEPAESSAAELEVAEPPLSGEEPFEPASVSPFAEEATVDETGEAAPREVLDYDSMKTRIEVTRSRLKAKAFDAMMTGESALLSREPEGAKPKKPVVPGIDSEIDQTIETGLREQEE